MSGSASLAAAKRRRAGPSVTNEPPKTPNTSQTTQSGTLQNISNIHPLAILAKHEQLLNQLSSDIEELYKPTEKIDEQSIQFFKQRYDSITKEMDEMKKLLIKIQTFSMETNLELLKMKRLLKNDPRMKELEEPSIENLSINDNESN